jgi:hypothetical protein
MWRESHWSALSLYWFRGRSADADLQTQPSHDDGTSNASSEGSSNDDMGNAKSESHDDQLSLMSSPDGPCNAWRCQWNVTGTVLASSGDGGVVQLWKTSYDGQFQCVSQIQGDLTALNGVDDTTDRSLVLLQYCRARSYI